MRLYLGKGNSQYLQRADAHQERVPILPPERSEQPPKAPAFESAPDAQDGRPKEDVDCHAGVALVAAREQERRPRQSPSNQGAPPGGPALEGLSESDMVMLQTSTIHSRC